MSFITVSLNYWLVT